MNFLRLARVVFFLSAAWFAWGAQAEDTGNATPSVAESLGVRAAAEPVRARAGWRAPKLILVTPRLHAQMADLAAAAPGVKLVELDAATPAQVAAADATIGVCSAEVLTRATHLQWIQWLGAGVEGCVHEPKLRERNPLLTNMQSAAGPSMAEHVMAMMLVLSRHLDYYLKQQEQGHWADEAPALADLSGKTVLVVGLGGIGTEVARRAHAFGMKVIATRASGRSGPDYVSYVGLPDELLKLSGEADFVVNCAPLTAQTTGIFNAAFFASMKPGAFFLNVGRGRSAVTADLTAALTSGRIAGAGLDVIDPEPLPATSPLWHLPNVIITPHISAATPLADSQRALLLRENLRRYVAGEPMLAVVEPERGY
ncbi:MAG TPA: D-2-hydroxyacid dehydrogenase [Steroidobacteraceae bacterium]|jgi:phosphoglycerate dehydrogenase-like enzyme